VETCGQHADARCKAECEARVVREAWRLAWAKGPSRESKTIAGQWVLKGGGLIQVDQGNGQAHGRKAQDSAGLHAGQQQQGARARGPGQQGERAEAQGSREASSAGDQQRPKARHGPEARLGSKSREARRGS